MSKALWGGSDKLGQVKKVVLCPIWSMGTKSSLNNLWDKEWECGRSVFGLVLVDKEGIWEFHPRQRGKKILCGETSPRTKKGGGSFSFLSFDNKCILIILFLTVILHAFKNNFEPLGSITNWVPNHPHEEVSKVVDIKCADLTVRERWFYTVLGKITKNLNFSLYTCTLA